MKRTFTFIKMRFAFFALSFFSFISLSQAQQTYNWVGGVSSDFYDANNWDDTSITFSDLQSYTFVIGSGNPNNLIHVGGSASDITKRPGKFNTTASANVVLKGNLIPWNSDYLNGILTLESPANINIRSNVYLGQGTIATLNVNGGAFYNRYAFYVGNALNGNATANITGGTVYVGTYLEVGTGTGNPIGNLNITGGVVDVPTAVNIGVNGKIFISGLGQLIVTGDKKTILEDFIANGKITCPSGQSLAVAYNGTRTSVTISQDPNRMIQEFTNYIILKNGKIEAKIQKGTSNVQSLKINGVETLLQTNTANPTRIGTYYDLTTSAGFETIGGASFSIKEETADYIDVNFSRPYISGVNATPVDVEIHYVLKKGDAGLYTYSILRHKATYPKFDLGSWRQVMWINNSVTDKICVTDQKSWNMPQPGDTWEPTAIQEIIKITSGERAGKYDGKYQFSENLINLKAYGHSSDKNNLGIWAVMGNHEYFNGGPTHHDLNSASGIIHVCMNGVHYNDKGFVVDQGEEWSKIYGPYLMYANQSSTAVANWDDAKARAAQDEAAWPFSWLTNTAEYPLADGRGNITGSFSISDSAKPEVNGGNAWIGVTQLSSDSGGNWQFEEKNYQYWVKTDASGNFNIKNVRPGTYTLFAFKDGTTGEYRQETVVVTPAGTTSLGSVNWLIPRNNGKIVFEIGVPDRTAAEYKFGDFDYCEGFVQDKFATTFTNPIEYNVEERNWTTVLPYVQSSYFKADGSVERWDWNVNFTLSGTIPTSGNAKLTIAYASADHAQNWIDINGYRITPTSNYPPVSGGNAFLRQSNHAKYGLATFDIPYSKLKVGKNTLKLYMPSTSYWGNHIMYDYISLEGELTSTFNFVDTDKDGVSDDLDLCLNTPSGSTVDANGCFTLPQNNFTIEVVGESCVGKKNGKIIISATKSLNYSTVINGVTYTFTTTKTVDNLAPGVYDFCISVASDSYSQCFSVVVESGTNVSARTAMVSDKLSVDVEQGTAPFTVLVNGKNVLETAASSFSVDVNPGDLVQVQTAVACEGTIDSRIDTNLVVAFPNPTEGTFAIAVPLSLQEVKVDLLDVKSQLISSGFYKVTNGKVKMDIEDKAVGVYFVKVYLDEVAVLKIIKQ